MKLAKKIGETELAALSLYYAAGLELMVGTGITGQSL